MPDLGSREVKVKTREVKQDEGPRSDTSLEALAKLKTVFAQKGSVTAGNSSQMSDGAGAVLLCSEAALKRYNLTPIGKFLGFGVAGVPPEIMGIGPKEAIPRVLKQVGLTLNDMGWIELNEAFAAQSLAVINDVGLDPEIVNPLGGAIALGPPAGRDGRDPHRDPAARPAPAQAEVRHGDDVHRHRHGRGRRVRGVVNLLRTCRLRCSTVRNPCVHSCTLRFLAVLRLALRALATVSNSVLLESAGYEKNLVDALLCLAQLERGGC